MTIWSGKVIVRWCLSYAAYFCSSLFLDIAEIILQSELRDFRPEFWSSTSSFHVLAGTKKLAFSACHLQITCRSSPVRSHHILQHLSVFQGWPLNLLPGADWRSRWTKRTAVRRVFCVTQVAAGSSANKRTNCPGNVIIFFFLLKVMSSKFLKENISYYPGISVFFDKDNELMKTRSQGEGRTMGTMRKIQHPLVDSNIFEAHWQLRSLYPGDLLKSFEVYFAQGLKKYKDTQSISKYPVGGFLK